VCTYASLRNNTYCSELQHLFNSVKGKEMQETDIGLQAVGYCLKKDKGVKTRTLVYFLVTIKKSIGSSLGCKVVKPFRYKEMHRLA